MSYIVSVHIRHKMTENKQGANVSFFQFYFHTIPYLFIQSPTLIQLFALQKEFKLAQNKTPILPCGPRQ